MNTENEFIIKPVFYTNLLNDLDKIKDRHIYRYVKYEHLYTWYKSQKLYLPKPGAWDDPFENILLNAEIKLVSGKMVRPFERNFIYANCWTLQSSETDAFWRIYSPYKNRVRIRTTIRQLWDIIYQNFDSTPGLSIHYGLFMGKFEYVPQNKLEQFVRDMQIRQKMISSVDKKLPKTLLFKRNEFRHEKEVRLIIYDFHKRYPRCNNNIILENINPAFIIDEILFDPRTSGTMFQKRLKKLQRFSDNIRKSELYSIPEVFTEVN